MIIIAESTLTKNIIAGLRPGKLIHQHKELDILDHPGRELRVRRAADISLCLDYLHDYAGEFARLHDMGSSHHKHNHHHHPHPHVHSHHHHHHGQRAKSGDEGPSTRGIAVAFFINLLFTLIELIGGYWSGSVAVIADAIHDLGDSVSLGVSWYLEKVAQGRPSVRFTYGLRRFSLLAALFSGIVVITGGVIVILHSLERLWSHETASELKPQGMIFLALVGIAANAFAAWRLAKGSTQNQKILTWHLLEDTLGWAVVLIGAIVIGLTGWAWLDPVLAIAITVFISINVIRLSRQTLELFLQGSPVGFDQAALVAKIRAMPGVLDVHEVHAWSLDGATNILSLHVNMKDRSLDEAERELKEQIRHCISEFGNFHSTIEIEYGQAPCPDRCQS